MMKEMKSCDVFDTAWCKEAWFVAKHQFTKEQLQELRDHGILGDCEVCDDIHLVKNYKEKVIKLNEWKRLENKRKPFDRNYGNRLRRNGNSQTTDIQTMYRFIFELNDNLENLILEQTNKFERIIIEQKRIHDNQIKILENKIKTSELI